MQTQTLPSSLSSSAPAVQPRGKASVRHLPLNLFASVMGLSGLTLAWRVAHPSLGLPAFVGEAVGALAVVVFVLLAVAYLTKLTLHPEVVHAEFHHPVAGNFFGTIVIAVLLLSSVVAPYSEAAARSLWTVGALATFILSFIVVSRLLKGEVDASHAVPAWLIPGVATLDIAVTGGHMPMAWAAEVNLLASAIGAMLALALFVMIVSRLVHRDRFPAAMTPSLMILVAPFAVGFLAYTNVVGGIDRFAALLFYFALFMFAVVAPKVFRRGIAFSPAWWAIGFPIAALANAALRYAELRDSMPLWAIAVALLGLLSLAMAVLTVRTLRIAFNGKLLA